MTSAAQGDTIRRVGVIGLGRMGLPMAGHLIRAGFVVGGFDLDPQRRASLVGIGGIQVSSVPALAETSDAVLVLVADDAQVVSVTVTPGGVLETAEPGSVVIISSTVKPSTVQAVADAAARKGIGVLDAPVARGQLAAEAGTLTVFAGGKRSLFERCRPVFEAFGKEIVHIDERVGAGQVAKLVNNLILWAGVVAVHESLSLAERLGVDPARLRAALQHGSADSYVLRELHLINLTWPHKDIDQALEVAAEAGYDLPLTNSVGTLIRRLTREELQRLCGDDRKGLQ